MKILCLNTAFKTAQIACEFEAKRVFKEIDAEAKSSENVLPTVEKILSSNNLTPKNLTHIGVIVGPGSFTGLRIGVAIVKGFVCVFPSLKIISANSLDFMAFQYVQENQFNFQKRQLNVQEEQFKKNEGLDNKNSQENQNFQSQEQSQKEQSQLSEQKQFYCVLNAFSERYFLAKYNENGERLGGCLLTENLPNDSIIIGLESENLESANKLIKLKPEYLLNFIKKLINKNEFISLEKLNPFYLRLSQAEENLIKKK